MGLAVAKHNILKASTLACGVAIYSVSCPAAKAIEIDPYPGSAISSKTTKNSTTIVVLTAKPYLKRIRGMETKKYQK